MTIDRQRIAAVNLLTSMGYTWKDGTWEGPAAQHVTVTAAPIAPTPSPRPGWTPSYSIPVTTSITTGITGTTVSGSMQSGRSPHSHGTVQGSAYPSDPWARFVKSIIEMQQALASMYPGGKARYIGIERFADFAAAASACPSSASTTLPNGMPVAGVALVSASVSASP